MTRRTTIQNYDTDFEAARALFDGLTHYAFYGLPNDEVDEQIHKAVDDALNNEWKRGISIEKWVALAMEAINLRPPAKGSESRR